MFDGALSARGRGRSFTICLSRSPSPSRNWQFARVERRRIRGQQARYTGNHFNEVDDRYHDGDRRGRWEHIGVIADTVFAESVNETADGAKELTFKVFLSREK